VTAQSQPEPVPGEFLEAPGLERYLIHMIVEQAEEIGRLTQEVEHRKHELIESIGANAELRTRILDRIERPAAGEKPA